MPGEPWLPVSYDKDDVLAFKALAQGVASEGQQRRALAWIINKAAGTYDLSFRPGPAGDRETAFAEGKRYVGNQVVKMINLPSTVLDVMDAQEKVANEPRRIQRTRRKTVRD